MDHAVKSSCLLISHPHYSSLSYPTAQQEEKPGLKPWCEVYHMGKLCKASAFFFFKENTNYFKQVQKKTLNPWCTFNTPPSSSVLYIKLALTYRLTSVPYELCMTASKYSSAGLFPLTSISSAEQSCNQLRLRRMIPRDSLSTSITLSNNMLQSLSHRNNHCVLQCGSSKQHVLYSISEERTNHVPAKNLFTLKIHSKLAKFGVNLRVIWVI